MSNIDEYGEIKDEHSSFKIMAESIALKDARKDLRETSVDPEFCTQIGNDYFIIVDGYTRFGRYAWITYLIDENGWIEERDINYRGAESNDKRGCIIITAFYNDHSSEVFLARQYRDNILSKTKYGRLITEGYYCIVAPLLINLVKKVHIFKKFIKSFIVDPILAFITESTNKRHSLKKYSALLVFFPCILILYIAGLYSKHKIYWRH